MKIVGKLQGIAVDIQPGGIHQLSGGLAEDSEMQSPVLSGVFQTIDHNGGGAVDGFCLFIDTAAGQLVAEFPALPKSGSSSLRAVS